MCLEFEYEYPYLKASKRNLLKHASLILLIFFQYLDQHGKQPLKNGALELLNDAEELLMVEKKLEMNHVMTYANTRKLIITTRKIMTLTKIHKTSGIAIETNVMDKQYGNYQQLVLKD